MRGKFIASESPTVTTPFAPQFPSALFKDAQPALARVREIYRANIEFVRESLDTYVSGSDPEQRVRGRYPFIRVHVDTAAVSDSRSGVWLCGRSGDL